VQSIVDEYICGTIKLIHRKSVQLNINNNFKFGILPDNMSVETFLKTAKAALYECYAKDCKERGTKTCSICYMKKYCSVACQKKDWHLGGHKYTCVARQRTTFIKGKEYDSLEEAQQCVSLTFKSVKSTL
jgi:hypothetical protein